MNYKTSFKSHQELVDAFDQKQYLKAYRAFRRILQRPTTVEEMEERILPWLTVGFEARERLGILLSIPFGGLDKKSWRELEIMLVWQGFYDEDENIDPQLCIASVDYHVPDPKTNHVVKVCSMSTFSHRPKEWINEILLDADDCPVTMKEKIAKAKEISQQINGRKRRSSVKSQGDSHEPERKYLIYSYDGECYSPNGTINDNLQILGGIVAKDKESAIDLFVEENKWQIAYVDNDIECFKAIRLHDDVNLSEIFLMQKIKDVLMFGSLRNICGVDLNL